MADTVTTHYGLTKPQNDGSDDTWGLKLNTDMDTIDTTMYANQVAAAAAQASATAALAINSRTVSYKTPGTYVFTPPADILTTTVLEIILGASGGAGGGASTNPNCGIGGDSGGVLTALFSGFTAAQPVTIVIPTGGAGSSGATGNDGSTATMTCNAVAVMTCTGGKGGAVNAGSTTVAKATGTGTATAGASGLTLVDSWTGGMRCGNFPANNNAPSGEGGGNMIGVGGAARPSATQANGNPGTLGAGGSGGINAGSNATGGAGGDGFCIIRRRS